MIFWVATAIIAILVVWWIINEALTWSVSLGDVCVAIITGFMGWAAVIVLFALYVGGHPTGYDEERYELRALGNSSEVEGSFFLGSGVIDEEQVFQYLQVEEDGGVTLHSAEADDVVVYEEANESGYMIVQNGYFLDTFWFPWKLEGGPGSNRTEFHVPEGSINNEYRVSVTE